METDKMLERDRYDERALNYSINKWEDQIDGIEGVKLQYRAPYLAFVEKLKSHLTPGCTVLEIGAGTGAFTGVLLRSGAEVCATDISAKSLEVLENRYRDLGKLKIKVADMECLPFADNQFDLVSSAGSLSYGDNVTVMNEIYRVLKDGGVFVCVDSLHHNPVYRFNRVIDYVLGKRTKSTLIRMPTLDLLSRYGIHFRDFEIMFFGSISYLMPLFVNLFGATKAACFSDFFDKKIGVKKSAFKFVMVAYKNPLQNR